jgi:hypothetical protein
VSINALIFISCLSSINTLSSFSSFDSLFFLKNISKPYPRDTYKCNSGYTSLRNGSPVFGIDQQNFVDNNINQGISIHIVTMKKPSNWLVVLYDVPSSPSKLKVRLWREFKRIGALYPQLSICVVPDNTKSMESIKNIEKLLNNEHDFTVLTAKGRGIKDQGKILSMFRIERDKQFEEILEECQEFIDEIKLNVTNKKTTQEEAEEMEEVLEGLYRWFDRVKAIDWDEKSMISTKVEKLLKKCGSAMDGFAEASHPDDINTGKGQRR